MGQAKPENQTKVRIQNVSLHFGGTVALNDVNLEIRDNELLALIGPNGSGKTSLLNCITGYYRPQKGDIFFKGSQLAGMRPDKVSTMGISRSFQKV